MMTRWLDILKAANNGNPSPDQKLIRREEEWEEILSPEVFRVTRKKGTEKPFSSEMCSLFEPGLYACACCSSELFDSEDKFESGSGWPSFSQALDPKRLAYRKDRSHGMYRMEVLCNICDAHLGHVFQDGPLPSGLRYCINALALKKVETSIRKVTLGGGCFWCTEAFFQELKGVLSVRSGYAGGKSPSPSYREVSSGMSGHAEVVQIEYDSAIISLEEIYAVHFNTHNPTTLNKQGADRGTQYRSIIFYRSDSERLRAVKSVEIAQEYFDDMIITELAPFQGFYEAEPYHQNYFKLNPQKPYCQRVILPKLEKLRMHLRENRTDT